MLHVRAVLGRLDEARYSGRTVERLPIHSSEAAKARMRRRTDAGTDVAIELPRGTYLQHGAVLADDGKRIVVVERTPEEAAVVSFSPALDREELLGAAVSLGHAFGNQHVPLDVAAGEVRVPVTTSREVVLATIRSLDLPDVEVRFDSVPLALARPAGIAAHGEKPMTAGFLGALQLADSALPIGRFVHSNGLEALLQDDAAAGEETIADIVRVFVTECVAPLDGVVLAHAHRATDAGSVERLVELDLLLETFKTTPAARLASTSCGHRLVALAPLLVDSPTVAELSRLVAGRRTPGNLAVVDGAVACALGVDREAAVLIELRGAAAGLFSAAVRLGRLSALRAQGALRGLEPPLHTAAAEALRAPIDLLRAAAPELEIYALRHRRADARLFMT